MSEARENNFETLLTITLKQQKIIEQLEQQNKQMIESLRYYLIYNLSSGGLVFTKIKNCYESVTGKKIEEIMK